MSTEFFALVARARPVERLSLIVLASLVAVSSAAGGLALALGPVLGNAGISLPVEILERSPFASALIPGLVLLLVVCGTHVVAVVLLLRRHPLSSAAAAVAGFGLLIWIFVQMVWIEYSALQTVYFAAGLAELILVLLLLGIVSPDRLQSDRRVRVNDRSGGRAGDVRNVG